MTFIVDDNLKVNAIIAASSNSIGADGQILASNGSVIYWTDTAGDVPGANGQILFHYNEQLQANTTLYWHYANNTLEVSGNVVVSNVATFNSNKYLLLPRGTTGERDSSPVKGQFRYNTTLENIEWYNGSAWQQAGTSAGEENQNAYSNLIGDSGSAAADAKLDTITFTGANGITTTVSDVTDDDTVTIVAIGANGILVTTNGINVVTGNTQLVSNTSGLWLDQSKITVTESQISDLQSYLTSYTETDPVVAAISGIVKSNGSTISAAVAGTDYLTDVSQDTTPQLGGNLDAQNNNITNLGTINTHTIPGGTGTLALTSDLTGGTVTEVTGGNGLTVTNGTTTPDLDIGQANGIIVTTDGINVKPGDSLLIANTTGLFIDNTGVGSGLNADLLDSQQGSYYLNETTNFGGDVSGTYNDIQVTDDSHNHIIDNVDGLQSALDLKAPLASPALTGTATAVNLTISGDLTVNGTTSTINSDNINVANNLIELNSGLTGANPNDSGIIIERGSSGDNAFIGWDESADQFILGTTTATGDSIGNLTITSGTIQADITGTAADADALGGTAAANYLKNTDGANGIVIINNGINVQTGNTQLVSNTSGLWLNAGAVNISEFVNDANFVDYTSTPLNNQIAIFTDTNTIEGDANFTWSGTVLDVTGQFNIDNIRIDGNVLSTTDTDGDLTITPDGKGYVQFSGNTIILPTGITANRPQNAGDGLIIGALRYNTTDDVLEWYSGAGWQQAGTATGGEINQFAYSNLSGDSGSAAAEAETDTIIFTGGDGITTTVSDTGDNDTVTIDIDNDGVTYAKIQNVSTTNRILGRITAGAGDTEELTAANVRTIINVEDGATADQTTEEIQDAAWGGTTLSGTQTGITVAYQDSTNDVDFVTEVTLVGSETLTNKTINGDNNTLTDLNIGQEVKWPTAADVADAAAFTTGDKLIIHEAGFGLRKIDYDDLPGSGGILTATNGAANRIAVFSSSDNVNGDDNLTFQTSTNTLTVDGNILITNTAVATPYNIGTLTAASTTINFNNGNHQYFTINTTSAFTFNNPSNADVGIIGTIRIERGASVPSNFLFGTGWKFPSPGTVPEIEADLATSGDYGYLDYYVQGATDVRVTWSGKVGA